MQKYIFLLLSVISIFSFAQPAKKTTKSKTAKKTVRAKMPKDVQVWTIDAQRAKCEGVTTMQCLLVKKQLDKDFNLFYDNIEGFDYQEGFVYTIWVNMGAFTPQTPADGSSIKYELVKVVSKKPIAGYSNTTTIDNKKPLSGMNLSNTTTLIVNEEKTKCEGNPMAKCLLIKKENAKTYEIFYQGIEGFVFEEGYRQTILVNERHVANPMVKQAEPIYTLISVVKKELIFDAKKDTSVLVDTPKTVLDKKWVLRHMKESDTTSFDIEDNGVWIQFNSVDNKLNGKAPCNSYFGGFNSDYISTIQTMAVGSTRMYCENMKFEDLYFMLLQNAERFEIKNGKLFLYKGKRLLLIFE
jgi:heat shock protein HslJ